MTRCSAVVVAALVASAAATFSPSWTKPTGFSAAGYVAHGSGNGTLYTIQTEGYSDGPIILANFFGTHEEIGYLYVALLGNQTLENHAALMRSISNNTLVIGVLEIFLDWQYSR